MNRKQTKESTKTTDTNEQVLREAVRKSALTRFIALGLKN